MKNHDVIEGFSKLASTEKIEVLSKLLKDSEVFKSVLCEHLHGNPYTQTLYSDFSENNISNYFLPYSIAPNFLINEKLYHIPMVTEESSVVAAASWAAKFWLKHGGFKCKTIGKVKKGQIHFYWPGDAKKLFTYFEDVRGLLLARLTIETKNMQNRGGGILNIDLLSKQNILNNYYQLEVSFDTVDSMGANFMNTSLESIASDWKIRIESNSDFNSDERNCDILMSIFSNYSPGHLTSCEVKTDIPSLRQIAGTRSAEEFVKRFVDAVTIAHEDVYRAVTHNKGILNGVDAVAIATGNDFRAIEANVHAFAARDGKYRSLSNACIDNNEFVFTINMPFSMGIVGGATQIHPFAKYSLEILGCQSADELQEIAVAAGLANNFSAIRSLVTTGIQAGHMKLHLANILNHLSSSDLEKELARKHFKKVRVSYATVKAFLEDLRQT